MLRLRSRRAGALEVAHEGRRSARAARSPTASAQLAPGQIGLAVFTSEGCGLCRVAGARRRRVRRAPERGAAHVRRGRATPTRGRRPTCPGSPFAVALDADGTVLAKGTFNTRRAARVGARRGGAAARGGARVTEGARIADAVAGASSRRGFLARVGAAVMGAAGATPSARSSRPARPRPTTSAATSTRPTRARTRPACRGSTRKGFPLRAKDGRPVDDLGRYIDADRRRRSTRTATCSPTPTAAARRTPRRTPRLRRRRRRATTSRRTSTARGTAAAAATCASSSTAAARPQAASTATGADRLLLPRPQGLLRHVLRHEGPVLTAVVIAAAVVAGRDRRVVAVRVLDGRDARARRLRRAAADDAWSRARRSRPARSPAGSLTFGGLALLGARSAPAARAASRPRVARSPRRVGEARGRADRPAGPPPGARVVAPGAAGAARGRALRRAAGPGLHDVRAVLRRLGARRGRVALGRPALGARCRARRSAPAARCRSSRWRRWGGGAACAPGDGRAAADPALAARVDAARARALRGRAVRPRPPRPPSRWRRRARSRASRAQDRAATRAAATSCAACAASRWVPGNHPAVGGGRTGVGRGPRLVIAGVVAIPAPGANAVAVSAGCGGLAGRAGAVRRRR